MEQQEMLNLIQKILKKNQNNKKKKHLLKNKILVKFKEKFKDTNLPSNKFQRMESTELKSQLKKIGTKSKILKIKFLINKPRVKIWKKN